MAGSGTAESLVGQGYNDINSDSDADDKLNDDLSPGENGSGTRWSVTYVPPSALSEDESDDETGPVTRPGPLDLDEYSGSEMFARIQVKPKGTFNKELMAQKKFHNVYALNAICKKFNIDQYGSDFSKDYYYPKDFSAVELCYTYINEKVAEHERKKARNPNRQVEFVRGDDLTAVPPPERKRASKWSEAVKPQMDMPMPRLPGLGLPLPAQAAIAPTVAPLNMQLQQAINIANRLKNLTLPKPPSMPALGPTLLPSAATNAAVAAAAAQARALSMSKNKASSSTSSSTLTTTASNASPSTRVADLKDEEMSRKRQAALTLLRESAEKKRKQQQ